MMNLLNKVSNSFPKYRIFSPGIFRVSLYSTQTQPSSSDTLFQRLHSGFVPQASIIPILDKWVVEGRTVSHGELVKVIKDFRRRHRFASALEIAEWMSQMKFIEIEPGDVAQQLELISKVHGVEQAENYFNSLKDSLKIFPVYGALLFCYADAKSVEKAEATMEKIRKMTSSINLTRKMTSSINLTLTYNSMLKLYLVTGKHEMIASLTQEMEDKGIAYDEFSYNILLQAYGSFGNVERMEELLMEMEVDPLVTINYHTYVALANGYLKDGCREKASEALKKAEYLIKGKVGRPSYIPLVSVYASMQKIEDVYRLWNLHKKFGKLRNMDYLCMIRSLEMLDDLDGAKKILEEWQKKKISFDIRIPNALIYAYCKKGHLAEAEVLIKRLVETGEKPNASTWSRISFGYYKNGFMEKALEATRNAFLASFPGWKPDLPVVAACLEYLKMRGDTDGAEEIIRLLGKSGNISIEFKEILERYANSGKSRSETFEMGMG